jgi:hypothetical protein
MIGWCQFLAARATTVHESEQEYENIECHDLSDPESCLEYSGCRWKRKTQTCFDMEPFWIENGEMVNIGTLPKGVDEFSGIKIRPTAFQKSSEDVDSSTIVIIPNCISDSVVKTIASLQSHFDNYTLIQDRTDDLIFSHIVHRIEGVLKKKHPEMYSALLSLMLHMDIWDILKQPLEDVEEIPDRLYPEIEYLSYEQSEALGFGRHVDNGSLITAIFMLTSRAQGDYEGGQLVFDPDRTVLPEQGDCVIFRGEELLHQVKPITKGRRMVLQIELHGHHESEGGHNVEDDDEYHDEDDEILYEL